MLDRRRKNQNRSNTRREVVRTMLELVKSTDYSKH